MDSNECYFGLHTDCSVPENCDCLCHVKADLLDEELQSYLVDGESS